jgi:hypothetical protein
MSGEDDKDTSTRRSRLRWLEDHAGKATWLTAGLTAILLLLAAIAFWRPGKDTPAPPNPTPETLVERPSPPKSDATATSTFVPIPVLDVRRVGVGSPDLPIRLVLEVTNLSDHPVVLWGVLHDTDTHQNRLYKAGRIDVDGNGGQNRISFAGWYPGACYVGRLLMARTQKGTDDLVSWFQEGSDTTRSYTEVIATGDIAAVYADENAVCIPVTPSP